MNKSTIKKHVRTKVSAQAAIESARQQASEHMSNNATQHKEKKSALTHSKKKKKRRKMKKKNVGKNAKNAKKDGAGQNLVQNKTASHSKSTLATRFVSFLRAAVPLNGLDLSQLQNAMEKHGDDELNKIFVEYRFDIKILGEGISKVKLGVVVANLLKNEDELKEFQLIENVLKKREVHTSSSLEVALVSPKGNDCRSLEKDLSFEPSISTDQIHQVLAILKPVVVNPSVAYYKCIPQEQIRCLQKLLGKTLCNRVLKECQRRSTEGSKEAYWADPDMRFRLQERAKEKFEALWKDHKNKVGNQISHYLLQHPQDDAAKKCVTIAKQVVHEEIESQEHGSKITTTELGFLICTTSYIHEIAYNIANNEELLPTLGETWRWSIAKAVVELAPEDRATGMKITNRMHTIESIQKRRNTSEPFCASSAGDEAEQKIKQLLEEHELSFKDEKSLQKRELDLHIEADKAREFFVEATPDFELEHPIIIMGKPIKWIEVKRTFTIPKLSAEVKINDIYKQLKKYAARYKDEGGGLVIWTHCGFPGNLESIPGVIHSAIDLANLQQQQKEKKKKKKKKKLKQPKQKQNKGRKSFTSDMFSVFGANYYHTPKQTESELFRDFNYFDQRMFSVKTRASFGQGNILGGGSQQNSPTFEILGYDDDTKRNISQKDNIVPVNNILLQRLEKQQQKKASEGKKKGDTSRSYDTETSKEETLKKALKALSFLKTNDAGQKALNTTKKILNKIVNNPTEKKYKTLISLEDVRRKVKSAGLNILLSSGFVKREDKKLVMPDGFDSVWVQNVIDQVTVVLEGIIKEKKEKTEAAKAFGDLCFQQQKQAKKLEMALKKEEEDKNEVPAGMYA